MIVFCHYDFEGTEICCVQRWVNIVQEGHQEHFFDESNTHQYNTSVAVDNFGTVPENGNEIDKTVFHASMRRVYCNGTQPGTSCGR